MPDPTPSPFDLPAETFRRLGHQVIDAMVEALRAEHGDPVLYPASGSEIRTFFEEPLPVSGGAFDEVLARWRDGALRYSRRNGHPRFFAYVCPSADPVGILADALASALNQTVTSWRSAPAATEVERLVLRWLDEMVGFQGGGSGVMVSGGSAANLHAVVCAVSKAQHENRLPSGHRHRMTFYLSREGHVSLRKAALLVGIPEDHVRLIDVDGSRRLRPHALRQALVEDRASGLIPAVVCASAGTANTGTIDPLDEVAELCAEQDVWFHIDGSYGAPAVITEPYRFMVTAFSRADSPSSTTGSRCRDASEPSRCGRSSRSGASKDYGRRSNATSTCAATWTAVSTTSPASIPWAAT